DEYDQGKGGYGWSWEGTEPPGAHLLASVLAQSWLTHHQTCSGTITPHAVKAPARARALLRWMANLQIWPCIHRLTPHDSIRMAQGNAPGHGAPGTERWQWKGAVFHVPCDPLHDMAMLTLAIALPPTEPIDLQVLITIWQQLARLAAHEPFAGEELPPGN
ncbi:MAG: hypothetical protein J2P37_21825, partial [Ktedonobacteraceae bacterium]|nr:hypothetical protein [Ktedonobacteraceae bacterium]